MNLFNLTSKLREAISNKKEKVSVIGLGYVGFPLACAISKSGKYDVYGYDLDKEKIEKIKKRISPVEDKQAIKDIKRVNIKVSANASIIRGSKYIIICVPTPIDHNKNPDLTPVTAAAKTIKKHLKKGQFIILESTVNPGVCEENILPILESSGLKGGIDFELVHCPERINPGDEEYNVYNIPRNVGALTKEGTKSAADFYRSFINAEINEVSSLKVAESTKIIENSFRDVNIAFVNELAQSFDKMGINLQEVIKGASNKPYAFMPHYPGCGVGGHCIPVDPYYLIQRAEYAGFNHKLLRIAREVNNNMPIYTVKKLVLALRKKGIKIHGAKIGLLGLSYKANIGDMRESPALEIKEILHKLGAKVLSCDPYCNGNADAKISEIIENCAAVIIATNHRQFIENKDWGKVKIIIDGRNCLDKDDFSNKNILYNGIGLGC